MANPTYDSFVNNERNPFVEQLRRTENEEGARERLESLATGEAMPVVVDESENDEEAPNSGFVIHVATEPGKGKAIVSLCSSSFGADIGLERHYSGA